MDKTLEFKADTGGITEPKGFCAAAAHSDIRGKQDGRLDTGIIYSETVCSAAGVFTKNAVKAAPVLDCQRILATGSDIHGVIVNVEMPMLARGSKEWRILAKCLDSPNRLLAVRRTLS